VNTKLRNRLRDVGVKDMLKLADGDYQVVEDFHVKATEYSQGDLDPVRFKAFRVSMGVYEQRKAETYMVRTRIPGGFITLEQFKWINELGRKHADGKIRFTSRQDVQFHSLDLKDVYPIMKALIEVGVITKGTGGNTVRNIECSPLSGVSLDDVFDVTPYTKAATNYFLKDPSTMNMPRKFKIAFSNSPADTGNATISDLGFIAKMNGEKKGFELYGGGGFGGNPRVSLKLRDFIEAKDILYYLQAMKNLFEKEGNRKNKNRARIRYIVKRLGEEKFIELFNHEVDQLLAKGNLDILVNEEEFMLHTSVPPVGKVTVSEQLKNILFPQKQAGYYSVYVHPQSGYLHVDDLDQVLNFLTCLDYKTSIRLTNTQGFFVRDMKEKDIAPFITIIDRFTSRFNMDHSLTCVGAATCKLGLCLSQNLLVAIKEEFKDTDVSVKASLPRLFISGCPNSCAQHEKGLIGFHGKAKRTRDGLVPMFTVSFGGKVGSGIAKMGEEYGDIAAKKIPEFLHELAKLKIASGIEDFEEFLKHEASNIRELVNHYANIELFIGDEDIYYDYGANERFSLKGRGLGECSTGVMDVIQLDLSNAKASLEKYKETHENQYLFQSAVSSARTLLVLKGVDTNKNEEIFKKFIEHFVETGYVKPSIKELFENLVDDKQGILDKLTDKLPEINYLYNRVKEIYESLNGSLNIPSKERVNP
jgi:sulfite reductase (ferredoxin)